ncbi:MAG: hypothetical protein U1E27_14435 [Kiritimatiellia bacterium]|nr:hypothetical protein [Kiritimatiellia bacterium]
MHDRYWENPVGAKTSRGGGWTASNRLSAEWLNETGWRVSTLNPGHRDFLRHYILPLRVQDQLGFSKGGFLVGTHGAESFLMEFARAFRALPAVLFDDVSYSSETVCVRMRIWEGDTWFYVVNTADAPATVSIAIAKEKAIVRDLSSGERLPPVSEPLAVSLEPFQLRSFRIQGESDITVR